MLCVVYMVLYFKGLSIECIISSHIAAGLILFSADCALLSLTRHTNTEHMSFVHVSRQCMSVQIAHDYQCDVIMNLIHRLSQCWAK